VEQLVKVSMRMPKSSLETVQKLAAESNVSMADVVNRAILAQRFFKDETAKGGKILIEDKYGRSYREIILP
jgi:hypothetical protein